MLSKSVGNDVGRRDDNDNQDHLYLRVFMSDPTSSLGVDEQVLVRDSGNSLDSASEYRSMLFLGCERKDLSGNSTLGDLTQLGLSNGVYLVLLGIGLATGYCNTGKDLQDLIAMNSWRHTVERWLHITLATKADGDTIREIKE